MNAYEQFKSDCAAEIDVIGKDRTVSKITNDWIKSVNLLKYSYHFEWLGRPIIQYPQDIVAMQELIWEIKPDLIIETGIAHGGSLIFSASMLALLDMTEAIEKGTTLDPKASKRKVLGIDIDIRSHNRAAIEAHPMASRIQMIQGSSVAPDVIAQVHAVAANYSRVLVCLDSNHTHEHALAEMKAYAPLTSKGSYCVVFDTVIEDMPKEMFPDRPWGPGDNPKTAVWEYLKTHPEFEIDKSIDHKLLISVAPEGYLKRIR
ncbi:MAG: cephalosporin hydroxylase family protein [Nitrosomonadales bacterium]|nr:cephalosporin hydroxylase family protein [Nitrosomonadales bacterium]